MSTQTATALATGSARDAAGALVGQLRRGLAGAEPVLVVAFASTAQPLAEVTAALGEAFPGARVLGASTAGEFNEGGDAKGAVSAFALAGDFRVFAGLGRGLRASPETAIQGAIETFPAELEGYPHRTALLLLDPLAGNGEEATLLAASLLGDGVRLAGGAAGDDLRMTSTQVALGAEAAGDAVVLALLYSKQAVGLGVRHGHRTLSKPLTVTRARENVIFEIDGRPAWDVWKEQTFEAAGITALEAAQEPMHLLRYEAGLATQGGDLKIRAPLSRAADGSISFACGVPEGSVIRITQSGAEEQVASARRAAGLARAQLGGAPAAGALVFDCICRKLILGDDFSRAVRGISEELGGVPVAGFETYGEIALDAGDMSGFHNTTSVVLAFPRG